MLHNDNKVTGKSMVEQIRVSDVVKAYLENRKITQDEFALALTESLVNTGISRVAVTNWKNGNSSPHTDFLLVCMVAYTDWRRSFAIDCLKVKLPEVFDSGMVKLPLPKAQ